MTGQQRPTHTRIGQERLWRKHLHFRVDSPGVAWGSVNFPFSWKTLIEAFFEPFFRNSVWKERVNLKVNEWNRNVGENLHLVSVSKSLKHANHRRRSLPRQTSPITMKQTHINRHRFYSLMWFACMTSYPLLAFGNGKGKLKMN